MNKNTLKSAGAVLSGLLTIIILSNGTDTILETTNVFPSIEVQRLHGFNTPWMVAIALLYRIIFLIVGGYTTAHLSPNRPMLHVNILAIVGTVLGILGSIAAWEMTPAWFSISLILLGWPCTWYGGKLKVKALSQKFTN